MPLYRSAANYRPAMVAVLTVVRPGGDGTLSYAAAGLGSAAAAGAGFGGAAAAAVAEIGAKVTANTTRDLISFPIRVRHARLERNNHMHADELTITAEWADAGVDPRLISSASIQFYLGDLARGVLSERDMRFIGIATRIGRAIKDGDGASVEMSFLDWTTLFISTKLPAKGIPDLDQTLETAWARICEHTGILDEDGEVVASTVSALAKRLEHQGNTPQDLIIGAAVAPRFRRLGKVQVKDGSDAWAVWQQCVGMLGLVSFIDGDKCIVTTATDYFTVDNPPRFIWGTNILDWSEHRKVGQGKGVGITSFDPCSRTTIEARWPANIRRKRLTATKAGDPDVAAEASDYDWFSVPSIADSATALKIAKRAYEERSRQELEGVLRTAEMRVPAAERRQYAQNDDGSVTAYDSNRRYVENEDGSETALGDDYDLLDLRAGDAIRVEMPDGLWELRGVSGDFATRIDRLTQLGYSDAAAEIIARGLDDVTRTTGVFHISKITATFDEESFSVDVAYANLIEVKQ